MITHSGIEIRYKEDRITLSFWQRTQRSVISAEFLGLFRLCSGHWRSGIWITHFPWWGLRREGRLPCGLSSHDTQQSVFSLWSATPYVRSFSSFLAISWPLWSPVALLFCPECQTNVEDNTSKFWKFPNLRSKTWRGLYYPFWIWKLFNIEASWPNYR